MKITKIVFMGTPDFAVKPLKFMVEHGYKPSLCITQPDRPKGRKKKLTAPIIKEVALEYGIPVHQPENINDAETIAILTELQPDLIITAAYGGYIGRKIRKLPRLAAVNIHPSLLPQYRGATPVNSAFWNGDKETGVTIFRLAAKMDAGAIISQTRYQIKEQDNYTLLLEKLSYQGAEDLIKLLTKWDQEDVTLIPQDNEKATYCRKLQREDLRIEWSKSANEIYNQVRALADRPGAFTEFRGKNLKVLKVKIVECPEKKPAGMIFEKVKNTGFIVAAGKGAIQVETIQPAGKKIMTASVFDLGARITIGEQLR